MSGDVPPYLFALLLYGIVTALLRLVRDIHLRVLTGVRQSRRRHNRPSHEHCCGVDGANEDPGTMPPLVPGSSHVEEAEDQEA